MKTNSAIQVSIFVAFLLSSCSNKTVTLEEKFNGLNKELHAEEIEIKGAFYSNPREMVLVDSVLLINDSYDGKCFSLLDVKNKVFLNRFGSIGRGPNELEYPGNMVCEKNEEKINFLVLNPIRYLTVNINELNQNQVVFTERFKFVYQPNADAFYCFIPVNDQTGRYFATGKFKNGMFGVYDKKGQIDTVFGEYTVAPEHKGIDNYFLGDGYQGLVASHPSKPLIAYAGTFLDLIEVVDLSGGQCNIKKYHGGSYAQMNFEGNRFKLSRYSPLHFTTLCTTERYIYALYSEKSASELMAGSGSSSKKVYVFDWDLNPIVCYSLDREINTIAVAGDDKALYSIALSKDNMNLVKWIIDPLR